MIAKIVFATSSFTFLIPHMWAMVISRFFMGVATGLLMSCCNGFLYQAALPEHRTRFIPLLSVSYAIAFLIVTVFGLIDNGGTVIWRLLFIVIGLIGVLDVLNMLLFLRGTDLVTYLIKFKGKKATRAVLDKMFRKDKADEIEEEFTKVVELESKNKLTLK